MPLAVRNVTDLLHAQKREVRDAMFFCLNFDSEGPAKKRKLAHFEGELAGIDEAITIVEAVAASESVVTT